MRLVHTVWVIMAHYYELHADVAHYYELHADVAHCYGTLLRHPWHTTTHGCDTLLQAALAHSGTGDGTLGHFTRTTVFRKTLWHTVSKTICTLTSATFSRNLIIRIILIKQLYRKIIH